MKHIATIAALASGAVSLALGGVVAAGWIAGWRGLVQTDPAFSPMQYNTAVGFLFCGTGLMSATAGRARLALAGGLLAAALGALSLLQSILHADAGIDRLLLDPVITTLTAHPGRIPPNAAVCLLLAGSAIVSIRRPGRWPFRPPALGIAGTLLGAFGLTAYIGYLADVPQAHGWDRLAHMAVQDAVGFTVLGSGLLAAAWRESRDEIGLPAWLPIPVGVGWAALVVCLWRALAAQARISPWSALPALLLIGGLTLAVSLAWSIHLLRTARRRTLEAEAANRGLLDEVAGHRETMAKLARHASDLEISLNTVRTETRIILSILNSMGDGVIVTDPHGKILLFNPETERLLGLGATEAPPQAWPAVYGFYRADGTTPCLSEDLPVARALQGETCEARDLFIRNPQVPHGHWASLGARPIRNARGEIQGAVVVLRDVNAYKAAERMKDEFVSVVSHELRTPITAIQGALGLLRGGALGELPQQPRSLLDLAHRNGDRLLHLINDILDMQKIESGRMDFKREPLDVMRVVEQAVEVNAGFARAYHVQVVLAGRVAGARAIGDADRLAQVMANLLSNAIKFSPPQGRVEVDASRGPEGIRVAVIDHGPGIPPAFRPRLFQKFAQADASTARRNKGTGLGLSICKAIVERLGGTLACDSEPNVRTVFSFTLPELVPEESFTESASPCADDPTRAAVRPALARSAI
jgi:signal transduction histidine kinase